MGGSQSNYLSKLNIKPKASISKKQFDAICAKYAKGDFIQGKDAKKFLKDLAEAVGVVYSDQIASDLIKSADDNEDGRLDLNEFQSLFFKSTDVYQISLSSSLAIKRERFHRRKPHKKPPPPPPAEDGKTGERRKWIIESRDNTNWNFDANTAKTMDLDNIPWAEALGFNRSEGGTTGVLFVGFDKDEVAVLKGSVTVMSDYFANLIGIEANMPIPRMEILSTASAGSSYKDAVSVLDKLDLLKKERLRGQHKALMQMPIISLTQFVPGTDFYNINCQALIGSESAASKFRLQQIGRLLAFDVLINNWDRFPVLWDGQGNLGNVFFGNDTTDPEFLVCGIDQCITSIIGHEENLQKYMEKVERFLDEIESFEAKKGSKLLDRLRDILKSRVMFDIGEKGVRQVWIGCVRGVNDILEGLELELDPEADEDNKDRKICPKMRLWYEDCVEVVDELAKVKGTLFDSQGQYGFVRVNIEFLEDILNRFDKRKKMPQLLKELKERKEVVDGL